MVCEWEAKSGGSAGRGIVIIPWIERRVILHQGYRGSRVGGGESIGRQGRCARWHDAWLLVVSLWGRCSVASLLAARASARRLGGAVGQYTRRAGRLASKRGRALEAKAGCRGGGGTRGSTGSCEARQGEPTLCSCGTITTMGYRTAAIAGEMPNGLQDCAGLAVRRFARS